MSEAWDQEKWEARREARNPRQLMPDWFREALDEWLYDDGPEVVWNALQDHGRFQPWKPPCPHCIALGRMPSEYVHGHVSDSAFVS